MQTFTISPESARNLDGEALDKNGRLRILPAAYWASTTMVERALFGHRHGLYALPTVELVDQLEELIAGRTAIEIGAGCGVLADALGIPGTDNRQQEMPKYEAIYRSQGQPTVTYGPHIVTMHASRAVRHYRPQVVIGSWVTHLYERARHWAGGNELGVDERDILANCDTYIHIGNEQVHQHKAIWDRPHTIEYPPHLYSRAGNGSRDFIAVWNRRATGPRPGRRP